MPPQNHSTTAIPTRQPLAQFLRGQRFSRLAAAVLVCWSCLLSLPELYRVPFALSSLGLSVDNNGVIVDVTIPFNSRAQSPAARAGLQPGDQIDFKHMRCLPQDTKNCGSLVSVMADLGGLGFSLPNFQATLAVLPKSSAPRIVTLQAMPAPLPWLDRVILLANTIASVIFIGIAFLLVWRRPSRMSWGFFLYAIWFNPGQGYTFYAWLQTWPLAALAEQVIEAFAQGAAYAGLLIFAIRFPTNTVSPSWARLERAVPWLGLGFALCTLAVGADLFGVPTEMLNDAIFIAGFIFDAAVILVLLLRLPSLHPQDEQRMRWAIAGCAIGIPCFLIADLCQSSSIPFYIFGATLPQPVIGLLYFPARRHGLFRRHRAVPAPRRQRRHPAAPRRHAHFFHLSPRRARSLSARTNDPLHRTLGSAALALAPHPRPHRPGPAGPPAGHRRQFYRAGLQPPQPSGPRHPAPRRPRNPASQQL